MKAFYSTVIQLWMKQLDLFQIRLGTLAEFHSPVSILIKQKYISEQLYHPATDHGEIQSHVKVIDLISAEVIHHSPDSNQKPHWTPE